MKLHKFPKHLSIAVFPFEIDWKPAELRKSKIESSILHGFFLELLSESLKFSFDLKNNTEFGYLPQNDSWIGCVGMVAHEEVDIAVCSLAMTESGNRLMTYSIPYLYTAVRFVTDKPQLLPNKFAIFYSFSWHIWLTLTVSFLFISFFFYFLFRRKYKYPYVLFQVFSSLLEQSLNLKSRVTSVRILTVSWIVGTMCLTYSYRAVLLASISFPNSIGIHNIEGLSEAALNREFKCAAYKANGHIIEALAISSVESFKRIAKCMIRNEQPWDVDGFLMNTSYKKAYLNVDYYLTYFKNDMFLSEDSFWFEMFAVAVNKRFCCVDTLNDVIYRIIESGLIEKELNDREFFLTLKAKSIPDATSNRILTLDDLFGAFIILIGGLMLSTFVFMLELIFYKTKTANKTSLKRSFSYMSMLKRPTINKTNKGQLKRQQGSKITHKRS